MIYVGQTNSIKSFPDFPETTENTPEKLTWEPQKWVGVLVKNFPIFPLKCIFRVPG